MKISPNCVVSLHYSVSTLEDVEIDTSRDGEPMTIIHGQNYLIQGLEDALLDKEAGDSFKITVEPELAYGERHDNLVQVVPNDMFEGMELEVGMQFRATTDEGEQSVIVVDINEEGVVVDGNHPLAGITLKFDVEVLTVREASEDELANGQVATSETAGHH